MSTGSLSASDNIKHDQKKTIVVRELKEPNTIHPSVPLKKQQTLRINIKTMQMDLGYNFEGLQYSNTTPATLTTNYVRNKLWQDIILCLEVFYSSIAKAILQQLWFLISVTIFMLLYDKQESINSSVMKTFPWWKKVLTFTKHRYG